MLVLKALVQCACYVLQASRSYQVGAYKIGQKKPLLKKNRCLGSPTLVSPDQTKLKF